MDYRGRLAGLSMRGCQCVVDCGALGVIKDRVWI
jgi:hypothetical protein